MIDAEFLVRKYLEPLVGARVVGQTPDKTTSPWIKQVQLDARAVDDHRSDHLIDYLQQFDIYASDQRSVWALAIATCDALLLMPGVRTATRSDSTVETGVVTGVRFQTRRRQPDTDFDPPRERVIVTASIFAHP